MRARRTPTNKSECKDDGYQNFGPPVGPFKNQGQCNKKSDVTYFPCQSTSNCLLLDAFLLFMRSPKSLFMAQDHFRD